MIAAEGSHALRSENGIAAEGPVLLHGGGTTTVVHLCRVSETGARLVAELRRGESIPNRGRMVLEGPGVRLPRFRVLVEIVEVWADPGELALIEVRFLDDGLEVEPVLERLLVNVEAEPRCARPSRVLAVAPSPVQLAMLTSRLELAGHRAVGVCDPVEAAAALVHDGPFDLAVVAEGVGGAAGADLLEWLADEAPEVRRIVLTPRGVECAQRDGCEVCYLDWLIDSRALASLLGAPRTLVQLPRPADIPND